MKKKINCLKETKFWLEFAFAFTVLVLLQKELTGQDAQVFRITVKETTQDLDFDKLITNNPTGCSVTIRAHLDSDGNVASAEVLTEAERSGVDSVWEEIRSVISSWAFFPNSLTNGTHNSLDFSIFIPKEAIGRPSVNINAKNLSLNNGWTLPFKYPDWLISAEGLDRGDIILTEVPPELVKTIKEGAGKLMTKILKDLHLLFQIAFGLLAIVFFVVLARTVKLGIMPWAPVTKSNNNEKRNYKEDFNSEKAKQIRGHWEKAIKISQLPGSGEKPYTEEQFTALEKLQEDAKDFAENETAMKQVLKSKLVGIFFREEEFYKIIIHGIKSNDINNAKQLVNSAIDAEFDSRNLNNDQVTELRDSLKNANTLDEVEEVGLKVPGGVQMGERVSSSKELFNSDDIRKIIEARHKMIGCLNQIWNNQGYWMTLTKVERSKFSLAAWELFSEPQLQQAIETIKRGNDGEESYALLDIFESGINNHKLNRNEWWTSQEIDRAIDRTLSLKVEERMGVLDGLWAIGSVSPLIGLFGTVYGIFQAFGKIGGMTNIRLLMGKLAGDINVALSTTIIGLLLGIFSFLFYYLFKYRIEAKATQIEKYFVDITNQA